MNIKAQAVYHLIQHLFEICKAIHAAGGICYLVGGPVRDLIIEQETRIGIHPDKTKDIDIEVHKLSLAKLEAVLGNFGSVYTVGKRFGVLRVSSYLADWSLPRTDSLGRKPQVTIDPQLSIEEACARRDLTINAMAIDLRSLEAYVNAFSNNTINHNSSNNIFIDLIDPYHGFNDLLNHQLRAVDERKFIEDPLRYFRVMQFIGRFSMTPDKSLSELCAQMSLIDPVTQKPLAQERVQDEFKKLFLRSQKPSQGLAWLCKTNLSLESCSPLKNIAQEPDRLQSLLQAVDTFAASSKDFLPKERLVGFIIIITFFAIDKTFLTEKIRASCSLITYDRHMYSATTAALRELILKKSALTTLYQVKKIAYELWPHLRLRVFLRITEAFNQSSLEKEPDCYALAEKAKVLDAPEKPFITGNELDLSRFQGPERGRILKIAYDLQLQETDITKIHNKSTLLERAIALAQK